MTTFYPVYEFTKQVVGDEGDVELLIGSGWNPMILNCLPRVAQKIQESDVFVYENENMKLGAPVVEINGWQENKGCQSDGEYASFYQVVKKSMTMREGKNTIMSTTPCLAFSTESH